MAEGTAGAEAQRHESSKQFVVPSAQRDGYMKRWGDNKHSGQAHILQGLEQPAVWVVAKSAGFGTSQPRIQILAPQHTTRVTLGKSHELCASVPSSEK